MKKLLTLISVITLLTLGLNSCAKEDTHKSLTCPSINGTSWTIDSIIINDVNGPILDTTSKGVVRSYFCDNFSAFNPKTGNTLTGEYSLIDSTYFTTNGIIYDTSKMFINNNLMLVIKKDASEFLHKN